ncbi:MAG: hypothetical protein KKB31_02200 [Nanoarchaeota archaeon]|nr:hypothetical protein [Nanoarchaeota archaeon]
MGMPKVDFDAMYAEIEKTDPTAMTGYGIAMNEKTVKIMQKHGYLQKEENRKEAIQSNKELLKKFKKFLEGRKNKDRIYSDINWYSRCNEWSGHVLKFDDMDEEHFNYILFNRAIRKVMGMSVKDYLGVMDSLAIFGEFLKQEGSENAEVFLKVASQKDKMKERLSEHEKLGDLCEEGKISEEEFGEKSEELFGYGYME